MPRMPVTEEREEGVRLKEPPVPQDLLEPVRQDPQEQKEQPVRQDPRERRERSVRQDPRQQKERPARQNPLQQKKRHASQRLMLWKPPVP